MQIYDFALAINGARQAQIVGSYIYYLDGSAGGADATISVTNDTGSDTILLMPGQAYRMPEGTQGLNWIIKNYANQAPIIGSLLIGVGQFFDNRISGSVEVIDGGKNRTMAGVAFMGGASKIASVGNFSQVQLWNPVGSGKNMVLETVTANSAVAGLSQLRLGTTKLSTSVGADIYSKYPGVGASVGEFWTGFNAAPINNLMSGAYLTATGNYQYSLREPIVIKPGSGVSINGAANQDVVAYFEFFEESA